MRYGPVAVLAVHHPQNVRNARSGGMVTVVQSVVSSPDGSPVLGAKVTITLVSSSTLPGFSSDRTITGQTTVRVKGDGSWRADITPNADLLPANTHYLVTEDTGFSRRSYKIIVPATGGPYSVSALLAEAPPSPDPLVPVGGDYETPAGAQAKVNAAVVAEVARSRREASFLARGAVMFSLDDGRAQHTELVALHEALGQRITLGITSGWVNTAGFLTSAQVLDFHNRGHEIANHSTTHANYTTITPSQRATESDTCSDFIAALTGVRPVSYIYPQGGWNATTDRELYGRFRSWAATLSPTTNLPPINRLGDPTPRYYRVDLDQVANLDRALELVRLASRAPVVVAFYMHRTDQPGTLTTAQYQSIAQLAYDLSVPAVLPRDMYGGFSALADSSFEVAGLPNWIQFVTGAGTTGQVTDTPDAGLAGTKALSVTATNPDDAYRSQAIWVDPNTTYRVSGRLRCPSGNLATNDVQIRVRWRLADESAISTGTVTPAVSGTGWTRFEGDLTSPALTRMALVDCRVFPGVGRGGTAYVDHVDIRPAEQGGLG